MFDQFKNADYSSKSLRERLIDTSVHKVILYNDRIKIFYNHTGDKNFDEIKKSENTEISGTAMGSDFNKLVVEFEINLNTKITITPKFIILDIKF